MPRILVVDDDTLVLAAVQMLLVDAGFEVVAVDQGHKAVQALGRGRFDAVIVDLFMAGVGGYQAIKEFRRIDPDVQVIAMSGVMFRESSGGRAPDFLAMADKLGATRSLHKPFKPAELLDVVRACVDAGGKQAETTRKVVSF